LTRVNEIKESDGIRLMIGLDAEDMKAMDTRRPDGYYEAVEISPQKGTMFAKVVFTMKPSTTPGMAPVATPVIIPIRAIVIGKIHAKEERQLKEAEAKKAQLEKMNAADRKRAEKMKNLSPCCEARMIHQDNTPLGIMTCTKCETKYRQLGTVWVEADIGARSDSK